MTTNPIFQFKTTTDTGIDQVPVGGAVYITDSDGNGAFKEVIKLSLGTLDETSTIADFLADTNLYDEFDYLESDNINTFTKPQRTSIAMANTGVFDLDVSNDFTCTPSASVTFDFSNIANAAGQGGNIIFKNTSDYAVTVTNGNIKIPSVFEADLSSTGTYLLSYYCDGTDVILLHSLAVD
jgi:hypothetical protein